MSIKFNQNTSELRTAESASPKHPDKVCDRMSDALLDVYLLEDLDSRSRYRLRDHRR